MTPTLRLTASVLGAAIALVAGDASAQGMPQVRDSRTGQVWTPEPLEAEPPSSSSASDRAFDPTAQAATVQGVVVEEHPRAHSLGIVPITAGPTVPLVTVEVPSLQVLPGREWLAILYLTNNSANTVDAVVECQFTNHGRKVEDARVIMPSARPGERLGVPVRGPRYDIFVDRVTCAVKTPT